MYLTSEKLCLYPRPVPSIHDDVCRRREHVADMSNDVSSALLEPNQSEPLYALPSPHLESLAEAETETEAEVRLQQPG
jgi:hypothetical protein